MQIFVDADACPVVGIVEKVAKEHNLPVTLLCDTNHVLSSDYSEVIVVGAGADAVDYKLISICHRGDIVVSQDYGVAVCGPYMAAMVFSEYLRPQKRHVRPIQSYMPFYFVFISTAGTARPAAHLNPPGIPRQWPGWPSAHP